LLFTSTSVAFFWDGPGPPKLNLCNKNQFANF